MATPPLGLFELKSPLMPRPVHTDACAANEVARHNNDKVMNVFRFFVIAVALVIGLFVLITLLF